MVTTVATGLLLGGAPLVIADDAHHPDDAPKAAEPAPQPKAGMNGIGMGGMMGKGMMMPAGMMEMMGNCPMMGGAAKPIDAVKAELGITDAQKDVWDAYAAARAKVQAGMQDMQKTMVSTMAAKTPVERIDGHLAAMEKQIAALKEVKPALAALYAALSDDQKKKADQILTGPGCMM